MQSCGKKGAVYAKDSIDSILAVRDDNDSSTTLWGFEAKGRVTATTAADKERQLRDFITILTFKSLTRESLTKFIKWENASRSSGMHLFTTLIPLPLQSVMVNQKYRD